MVKLSIHSCQGMHSPAAARALDDDTPCGIIVNPPHNSPRSKDLIQLDLRSKDCEHFDFANELLAYFGSPSFNELGWHAALKDPSGP